MPSFRVVRIEVIEGRHVHCLDEVDRRDQRKAVGVAGGVVFEFLNEKKIILEKFCYGLVISFVKCTRISDQADNEFTIICKTPHI